MILGQIDTEQEAMQRQANLAQETRINLRALKQDMFATKEELLLAWCRQKGVFSKADVMNYALTNFYLRADRSIRDFVKRGIMKRLNDREREHRGITAKMAYYEWIR
jgi:hypothetical protein